MKINWKRYIQSEPAIMLGKPVIKGTRITVELILEKLSEGESFQQILESHPHISDKAIKACLAYAHDSIKNETVFAVV